MELQNEISECINMFNEVVSDIGITLITELPNESTVGIYNELLKTLLKKSPDFIIDSFVKDVYSDNIYRQSILNRDEDFFLENNHKKIVEKHDDGKKTLFQFKSCWKKLSYDTQNYIKDAVVMLVHITEKYIEHMSN
jgi:hypothetical protein